MIFFFGQRNISKHLSFIFIFIFNLFKSATETRKAIYESANDKKSASKETTSSISYRKQVSRRKSVAYPYKTTQLNKRQPN